MPTYSLEFYVFGAGVTVVSGAWTVGTGAVNGPVPNSQISVASNAQPISIGITDDDLIAQDGSLETGAIAVLALPVTINSVAYPVGTQVQLEYGVDVESGGDGPDFYAIRFGDNAIGTTVGIMGTSTDQIVRGTVYTASTGSINSPTLPYSAVVCFTYGTQIDTPDGTRLIEALQPGDLVTTLDHGSQSILWIGTRKVSLADMIANPRLRPIRFETGVIGNHAPLLVSPQHRVLLSDWRSQVYFGEDQVLIAATALVNGTTIRPVMPQDGVTYCHLLCENHEILIAQGALSESFHPGSNGLDILAQNQMDELALLFPELANGTFRPHVAYTAVRAREARVISI